MATTPLPEFTGTPTLDEEKVAVMKRWLAVAQGDSDKTASPQDANYYQGTADAIAAVLRLLHDPGDEPAAGA